MRGSFDLRVPPLGCAVLAREEAAAVDPAEVAVDKRVAALGLVGRAVGETEEPVAVLVPRVPREERVLVVGRRLCIAPVAAQDVLSSLDQLPGLGDGAAVDGVGSDPPILAARVSTTATAGSPGRIFASDAAATQARRDSAGSATSSLNPGSPRIASKSESPLASSRHRSDMPIACRRWSMASVVRPARLSAQARL